MLRNLLNESNRLRASHLIARHAKTVLFVTPLLRARELKMASALRGIGWKVILVYMQTTPFTPDGYFDAVILARTEEDAHKYAKALKPCVCHVFSGAVDDLMLRFIRDKPAPVIIDMNDVFCPSLFNYCNERFEPTRECLEKATGLCARDLQAKRAERIDGFKLPRYKLLFPEYGWLDKAPDWISRRKGDAGEVRVVSVGTFSLETQGMFDTGYLQLARMLTKQRIHLHVYPHWFYRESSHSSFNWNLKKDFADFFHLQRETNYLHIHECLPLDQLADVLPQYDFGLVAGGNPALGQRLGLLKPEYIKACYSGRIADYLDARLPILINREVRLNYWILKRNGLAVDLAHLLRANFPDELLAIKRNREWAEKADAAATKLSVERNVARLDAFYERVITEEHPRLQGNARTPNNKPYGKNKMLAELREEIQHKDTQLELRKEIQHKDTQLEELQKEIDRKNKLLEGRTVLWALDELSGLLNWPEIQDKQERQFGMRELLEMVQLFLTGSGSLNRISLAWEILNFKHFNQLLRDGYSNFKRTIAFNYFNFLIQKGDGQLVYLESQLDAATCETCRSMAESLPDDAQFDWQDQATYRYFVLLLWHYVKKLDVGEHLPQLQEPEEGNPLVVPFGNERASQDLANSVLEYYSMAECVKFSECKRVLEIGSGYGRDAYVILKLNPGVQYTLVDIPPALFVAQKYLSSVFEERRVFHVRDFEHYENVRDEMEQAAIVCLLPHQLELLPDKHFDLSLNISSFGEMWPEQIKAYFKELERLTNRYFYMKQWKISKNTFDNLTLTEDDYPVSHNWRKIYSRTCRVQTDFFEALHEVTNEP